MVNYSFLLILLIIVFTNLYFNYYKTVETMSKKKRKKKKKKKKERKRIQEDNRKLNEIIMQTNNYKRQGILKDKLRGLNISQLRGYSENLSKQDPKFDSLMKQENIKKKIANNKLYVENLLSDFINNLIDWKYA